MFPVDSSRLLVSSNHSILVQQVRCCDVMLLQPHYESDVHDDDDEVGAKAHWDGGGDDVYGEGCEEESECRPRRAPCCRRRAIALRTKSRPT